MIRSWIPCLAIAVLASEAPAATAADSVEQRLQRLADSLVAAAESALPGFLLFAKDGATGRAWRIAAGEADTVRHVPLEGDHTVRIASNTKTYTAAAVLRLVERGTLALSDPLSRHLPASLDRLLRQDGYETDRMTIEQVLSHRAGLAEHPAVPSYVAGLRTMPHKRWSRIEQVGWMVDSLAPIGAPGERFRYSDTGYILLGAILERYTGHNLGRAVRDLIEFDRLGLDRTWFESLEPTPERARDRAHQYIGGLDGYDVDPSFDLYGGGGIVAPLEELGGFLEALLSGQVFDRPATLETMLRARSPAFGGYGLGIWAVSTAGRKGYGHTGFWGTGAFHFPASKVTVALAFTEQSQARAISTTVAAVLRILAEESAR